MLSACSTASGGIYPFALSFVHYQLDVVKECTDLLMCQSEIAITHESISVTHGEPIIGYGFYGNLTLVKDKLLAFFLHSFCSAGSGKFLCEVDR